MSTACTANVYLTNETDGTAYIRLFHQNVGCAENAAWTAGPGQTVGPLLVNFLTGSGAEGIHDYWAVQMTVVGGSTPGCYRNTGSSGDPGWKECELQKRTSTKIWRSPSAPRPS